MQVAVPTETISGSRLSNRASSWLLVLQFSSVDWQESQLDAVLP